MHIALDGSYWANSWTGCGQYVRELWRGLHEAELPADLRLTMVHPAWQELRDDPLMAVGEHYVSPPPRLPRRGRHLLYFDQLGFPAAGRHLHADALHATCTTAQFWGGPLIATFHDVVPLVLPEYQFKHERLLVWLHFRLACLAAKRAQVVIADAEFGKGELVRLLGIRPERIAVAYLAVNELYHPLSAEEQAAVRARLNLPAEYLFYIGGFDRRKNVIPLLEAYAAACQQQPDLPPLVIAGKVPDAATQAVNPIRTPDIMAAYARLGLGERVRWLGRISDEDKAAIYAAATIYIFPSAYEGFGLDPLEALASGTPVICSKRSSLPEVVGEAGVLIDPANHAEMTAAIVNLYNDTGKRAALREAGLQQAARFSWRRTAAQTVAAYRQALARTR